MITVIKDDDCVTFECSRASGVPERVYFPRKPENYGLKGGGVPDHGLGDHDKEGVRGVGNRGIRDIGALVSGGQDLDNLVF
jgi:hypothetical protein